MNSCQLSAELTPNFQPARGMTPTTATVMRQMVSVDSKLTMTLPVVSSDAGKTTARQMEPPRMQSVTSACQWQHAPYPACKTGVTWQVSAA